MDFFQFVEDLENYTTEKFLDDLQAEVEDNPYVKALQLQQWNEGKDSDGNILGRYTKTTELLSDGRKKAGELYDLFDTGQTRRGTYISGIQSDGDITWYFDAKSPAIFDLLSKLGGRIFGLQEKNLGQFAEISQDLGIDLLNKNLKL